MLANTDHGDAYTYTELARMCSNSGFKETRPVALEGSPETLVIATK
jgi:hypothetical protein